MRAYCGLTVWWPLLLAALVISGCGPIPMAFPKAKDEEAKKLVSDGLPQGVEVAPIEGVPGPMARLLAESTAGNFASFDIPSGVQPFEAARFLLHGRAPSRTVANGKVVIHWQLTDVQGGTIADLNQTVNTTQFEWEYGSPKVIREVGEAAARRIAAELAGKAQVQAQSHLPQDGLYIEPVSGAPGDGDVSLTRAIGEALVRRGFSITGKRNAARYVLTGEVDLSAPERKQQYVRITWTLSHTDGKEVGRATQENWVPEGTFDGRWGRTAPLIAAAAVDGVHNVIEHWEKGSRQVAPLRGNLLLPESADGGLPEPQAAEEGQLLGRLSDNALPPPLPDTGSQTAAAIDTEPEVFSPKGPPSELDPDEEAAAEDAAKARAAGPRPDLGANAPVSFLIAGITGAPGNGANVLRAALRQALRSRDLSVSEDLRQAGYLIGGKVAILPSANGRETARIVWAVADRRGKVLGRAAQEKLIEPGSLDADWTPVAGAVAAGAVAGIERILGDKVKPFVSARGPRPASGPLPRFNGAPGALPGDTGRSPQPLR